MPRPTKGELPSALRSFQERRTDELERRVEQAIRELDKAGLAITIAAVAKKAGVSRPWLYASKHAIEIKELRARTHPSKQRAPVAAQSSDESLRRRLSIALEDNKRLRADNKRLREELGKVLGMLRERR